MGDWLWQEKEILIEKLIIKNGPKNTTEFLKKRVLLKS